MFGARLTRQREPLRSSGLLTRLGSLLAPASSVEVSPFWGIEKSSVLQDARCFNDSQLDARKCQQVSPRTIAYPASNPYSRRALQVITKLLYLVNQGDSFTKARGRGSAPSGGPAAGPRLTPRARPSRTRPPRSSSE